MPSHLELFKPSEALERAAGAWAGEQIKTITDPSEAALKFFELRAEFIQAYQAKMHE